MFDANQPIRILRACRYGKVGSINVSLDWGVRSMLVQRHIAEWVVDDAPKARSAKKDPSEKKELTNAP